jgi:hypothetical protein
MLNIIKKGCYERVNEYQERRPSEMTALNYELLEWQHNVNIS